MGLFEQKRYGEVGLTKEDLDSFFGNGNYEIIENPDPLLLLVGEKNKGPMIMVY